MHRSLHGAPRGVGIISSPYTRGIKALIKLLAHVQAAGDGETWNSSSRSFLIQALHSQPLHSQASESTVLIEWGCLRR